MITKTNAACDSYQVLKTYQNLETSKSRLTFLYLNARSIRKKGKLDELKCTLKAISTTIHIILITETWNRNEAQAQEMEIPNYTHYYNYRTDTRGGGVSIYVHNNLEHSLSESCYTDGNNYLWVHLKKYTLDIGLVYNPGDTNFKNFLDVFNSKLQHRNRAIVFGDFNIDLLTKDKETKLYKESVSEAGYKLINKISKKYCTRDSKTRKSILDHVITNLKNSNYHMAIVESAMSDHKQIYLELKKFRPPPKIYSRYEAINYEKLHTSFDVTASIASNDYMVLENTIKDKIKQCRSIKTKILNPPQTDWINKNIISGINKRNSLWAELKENPHSETIKDNYKEQKKHITKLIQDTKDSYYYNEFQKCMAKPKKMWSLVNNLANNKTKKKLCSSKTYNR